MSINPEGSKESDAEEADGKEPEAKNQQEKNEQEKKPVEFFKNRDGKRQAKLVEELATRDAKIQALEQKINALAESKKKESESDDNYSEKGQNIDPSAIVSQVEESLINRFKEANHKQFLADTARAASNWLKERDHVRSDPAFAKDVAEAIERDHSDIADVNPMKAARLAYADVCEARGISPDISNSDRSAFASQGVKGGRGISSDGKWTPEKIRDYIGGAKPGTPEHDKRIETVQKALSAAKS